MENDHCKGKDLQIAITRVAPNVVTVMITTETPQEADWFYRTINAGMRQGQLAISIGQVPNFVEETMTH